MTLDEFETFQELLKKSEEEYILVKKDYLRDEMQKLQFEIDLLNQRLEKLNASKPI